MSLDPVVYFFALGFLAGALRADLRLPPAIYEFVSTLLLLAIGLKGGRELAMQPLEGLAGELVVVVALGIGLALLAYLILVTCARSLPRPDAASLAAHYGSVSVGTFAVGVAYLGQEGIAYEPQLSLYLVLLEVPAIIVGVVLARGARRGIAWGPLAREILLGRSILLLLGGLVIGYLAGAEGLETLAPLFFDPFKGVLAIFLLEMGLIASENLGGLKRSGTALVIFALGAPVLFASIGMLTAGWMGLSVGGAVLLATLAGSASYIAAPAAMRAAVPEADPTLSITAALGVTFPFNIFVGIPLYHRLAEWLHA